MQGPPGVGQIQSVSVLQSGEQPSPPVRFPSSQVSAGGLSMPFPHGFSWQAAGGPSHPASVQPPRSGAPPSRALSPPAPPVVGAPPRPPAPVVLLLEIPAHPPTATTSANPSRGFTSFYEMGGRRFGSTASAG